MSQAEQPDLARLTVELLSAYVANNTVASEDLAGLIETTRAALAGERQGADPTPEFKPAVSIEDSLASPDHILSLIDGKPYRALKRHLTTNGLTPEEYKTRYNLPADYPLVAKSYSAERSKVARKMGLGGSRSVAPKAVTSFAATAKPEAKAAVVKKTPAKAGKPGATKASNKTSANKAVSAEPAKPAAPKAAEQANSAVSAVVAPKPVAKGKAAPKVSAKPKKNPAAKASLKVSTKAAAKASPASAKPARAVKGEQPVVEDAPTATSTSEKARAKPAAKMALLQSITEGAAPGSAALRFAPAAKKANAEPTTEQSAAPVERKRRKKLGISVGASNDKATSAAPVQTEPAKADQAANANS